MADTEADETLHFVNGKTDVDYWLQETKVKETKYIQHGVSYSL